MSVPLVRRSLSTRDQFLQRHGGEYGVGFQPFSVLAEDGGELSAAALDLPDPAVEKKLAPRGLKALRHGLPQLAGAEFGVVEFLNQGGLDLLILPGQELFQHIADKGGHGDALHPLGAPIRRDLLRRAAPHLLRVALEEHGIELPPEAVDVEVLQAVLRQLADAGGQIAEARLHAGAEAHVAEGLGLEADGIVEEMALVIDAADPVADEEDLVRFLRVRSAGDGAGLPAQDAVVLG